MIRFDDKKEPLKLKKEAGVNLLIASLLCSVAGIFWQPFFLGGAGVIQSFFAMKSPKGIWGIPLFLFGVAVMFSSIYR